MILIAFHATDVVVLIAYMGLMLGIGWMFNRQQKTSQDFFLAGRSMGWFPIGVSVMATLLSALSYTGVPGEAYYVGLKYVLLVASTWLVVPIMWMVFLPLYRGLQLCSVYEYLERRFDLRMRVVGSLVFVVWRLLWLGGVLYAPCKVLLVATGIDVPDAVILVGLGLVSTLYTFLGGMKAVIWTDVIQSIVMLLGIVVIVIAVCTQLDGGVRAVWTTVQDLGRNQVADTKFGWDRAWTVWGIVPQFDVSMLSFYVADQITAQRFLTARNTKSAKGAFLLNCISVSIMIPALAFTGLSLLAFYQQKSDQMRPIWVANINDAEKGTAATDDLEQPLLDWKQDGPGLDRGSVDPLHLKRLIEQRRLLRPNAKEPFGPDIPPIGDTSQMTAKQKKEATAKEAERLKQIDATLDDLLTEDGNALDIDKLAVRRRVRKDDLGVGGTSEIVINRKAKDELMPRFIRDQLPIGFAGLILAALFAASMSSMDSGLNSITTLCVTDYYNRLGWGKKWFAKRLNKKPEQLNEEDELRPGRPIVVIVGVLATLFSLFVGSWGNIFEIMIGVVNTFGGPLLAVFLLGAFTRRATSLSALVALTVGVAGTLWLMLANRYDWLGWWPFEQKLHSLWNVLFSVGATYLIGYFGGFFLGRPRPKDELHGLVVGLGTLGEPPKASIEIEGPRLPEDRWKE